MTFRERCALAAMKKVLGTLRAGDRRDGGAVAHAAWGLADAMEAEREKRKIVPAFQSTCAICTKEFQSHKPTQFCSPECFVASTSLSIHQSSTAPGIALCGASHQEGRVGSKVTCSRCLNIIEGPDPK